MMNTRTIICLIIFIAFCGVCLHWFFKNFERVEEEVDLGWSSEARKDPLLAAGKLLAQKDIELTTVDRFSNLTDLPQQDGLFLSSNAVVLSEQRLERLFNWVFEGGHLLYSVTENHNGNRIMSRLGARVIDSSEDHEEMDEDYLNTISLRIDSDEEPGHLTRLGFSGLDYELLVNFDVNSAIEWPEERDIEQYPEAFYWASDAHGIHFIQYYWGDGLVTLVTDSTVFENQFIGDYDNAFLWLELMGQHERVAIVSGSDIQSLWRILWFYLPEFIVISAVLFVAWLLSARQILGPKKPHTLIQRRSFVEHLSAAAYFYWRKNDQQRLLASLRKQTLIPINNRINGFDELPQADQIEVLIQCTPFNREQVQFAFYETEPLHERSFIDVVRILKAIRENL